MASAPSRIPGMTGPDMRYSTPHILTQFPMAIRLVVPNTSSRSIPCSLHVERVFSPTAEAQAFVCGKCPRSNSLVAIVILQATIVAPPRVSRSRSSGTSLLASASGLNSTNVRSLRSSVDAYSTGYLLRISFQTSADTISHPLPRGNCTGIGSRYVRILSVILTLSIHALPKLPPDGQRRRSVACVFRFFAFRSFLLQSPCKPLCLLARYGHIPDCAQNCRKQCERRCRNASRKRPQHDNSGRAVCLPAKEIHGDCCIILHGKYRRKHGNQQRNKQR